jgi:protein TonB
VSSITYRTPALPWAEGQQEHLFKVILLLLLILTLALGVLIPNISLPEIQRDKAEKLPPQLARVLKRKKNAAKPKPLPKVQEQKIENKPELKKVDVKPKPKVLLKPNQKVMVKPKPKPKKVVKKERSPERIKAAKEKAKKLISNFSDELADMQSMVDLSTLSVDSSILTTAGATTTSVGTVVDQAAVDRIGGVNEDELTRATGVDQLAVAQRSTTKVKELPKDILAKSKDSQIAGLSRTQMQIRRVFEQNKSRYDRIYRKALRSDPTLQGSVTFEISISKAGDVTACNLSSEEFIDKKALRRMASTCKMQSFAATSVNDRLEYQMAFIP